MKLRANFGSNLEIPVHYLIFSDSESRLRNALLRCAAPSPLVIDRMWKRAWASATFSGHRLTLICKLLSRTNVDHFEASVRAIDLDIDDDARELLADITVENQREEGPWQIYRVEALMLNVEG